jgi:hypothetical protein
VTSYPDEGIEDNQNSPGNPIPKRKKLAQTVKNVREAKGWRRNMPQDPYYLAVVTLMSSFCACSAESFVALAGTSWFIAPRL